MLDVEEDGVSGGDSFPAPPEVDGRAISLRFFLSVVSQLIPILV